MKKLTTLFFAVLFAGKLLFAQSVDDAKKSLYYGKTTSAIQTLNGLISSNPKNAEAIYWLGQAYLNNNNITQAQKVYQDALNNGVNDPLVWVGMGHVELLQGKKDAARQRFEAAITNSKTRRGENPEVLDAIGRANADGGTNVGDPTYGVDVLKRAAAIDPKNPDIFINMGLNYLKMGSDRGGDAYEAFNDALKIDPNYARADFRLGRIFLSQNNPEKYLEYFNKAIQADPKYAPASLELYNYYADRDVNKARTYLEQYMANSDKDCNTDYFYADYLFRAGQYQESLNKAKAMESGVCKDYPRLKVLYAYDYDRLGDSAQARSNIDAFMSSAKPENIQPTDYLFAAAVSKRFAGGEQTAINYLTKALENDTVRANRQQYMDTIAYLYRKVGNADQRLAWLKRSYQINPAPSDFDLYNLTDAAINAKQYATADSLSNVYIQKHPDQEYGYYLQVRSAKEEDADSTKGTAFPAIDKYITYLMTDSAKNMSKIKSQYYYMASVAADKMKDYPKAISLLERLQALDPQDPFATQALPVLRKAVAATNRSAAPASAKPKPKGKG